MTPVTHLEQLGTCSSQQFGSNWWACDVTTQGRGFCIVVSSGKQQPRKNQKMKLLAKHFRDNIHRTHPSSPTRVVQKLQI